MLGISKFQSDRWPDLAEILAASQLDARDNGAPSECQGGNPQVRMVDFREDMHPKKKCNHGWRGVALWKPPDSSFESSRNVGILGIYEKWWWISRGCLESPNFSLKVEKPHVVYSFDPLLHHRSRVILPNFLIFQKGGGRHFHTQTHWKTMEKTSWWSCPKISWRKSQVFAENCGQFGIFSPLSLKITDHFGKPRLITPHCLIICKSEYESVFDPPTWKPPLGGFKDLLFPSQPINDRNTRRTYTFKFPKMVDPFIDGFSNVNHPAIRVPPFLETLILLGCGETR